MTNIESNNVYVTYMSNDRDLKGVLVLNYNLKKLNSMYPLCCIIMESVSCDAISTLKAHNISIEQFNLKEYLLGMGVSDSIYNKINSKHVFGKFYIFNLTSYEKIIYLDADTLIIHNIDHLFDKPLINNMLYMVPDMQTTNDYSSVIFIKERYNSGVIIAKPDVELFQKAYTTLIERVDYLFDTPGVFISDQYIFEYMHSNKILNIFHLDIKYNIHPILIESALARGIIDKTYIIHFMVRPKPWEFLNLNVPKYRFENKICKEMFMLWIDLYLEYMKAIYMNTGKNKSNITEYLWGHYDNSTLVIDSKDSNNNIGS